MDGLTKIMFGLLFVLGMGFGALIMYLGPIVIEWIDEREARKNDSER